MNKHSLEARKYIGTTDPKEVNLVTGEYKNALKVI